jgi:hypothetical protein
MVVSRPSPGRSSGSGVPPQTAWCCAAFCGGSFAKPPCPLGQTADTSASVAGAMTAHSCLARVRVFSQESVVAWESSSRTAQKSEVAEGFPRGLDTGRTNGVDRIPVGQGFGTGVPRCPSAPPACLAPPPGWRTTQPGCATMRRRVRGSRILAMEGWGIRG